MSGKKIVVAGVTKSFASNQGMLPVIEEVSFGVDDGEFVAIEEQMQIGIQMI